MKVKLSQADKPILPLDAFNKYMSIRVDSSN